MGWAKMSTSRQLGKANQNECHKSVMVNKTDVLLGDQESGENSSCCNRPLPGCENLFVLQLLHSRGGGHRHGDHYVVDVKGALASPPLDGLLW